GFAWWARPVLVGCWAATHWLLRESGVWKDRQTPEVRAAQRHADYAYRLVVDPEPAKELRLFGLAGWVVQRFVARRRALFELQYRATRLRERSVLASLRWGRSASCAGPGWTVPAGWSGWSATPSCSPPRPTCRRPRGWSGGSA